MWSAVNRIEKNSQDVMVPEERISAEDALKMWTINGAYASFEEDRKGTIERGKLADFVVLSGDPREEEISSLKVEMTIVGGTVVYGS